MAEGICTLTLDRPERLNAVTGVMIAELCAALDYPWWDERPFRP